MNTPWTCRERSVYTIESMEKEMMERLYSPEELSKKIEKIRKHSNQQYMFFGIINDIKGLCDTAEKVYCKGWTAEELGSCLAKAKDQVDKLKDEIIQLRIDKKTLENQMREREILLEKILPPGLLKQIKIKD